MYSLSLAGLNFHFFVVERVRPHRTKPYVPTAMAADMGEGPSTQMRQWHGDSRMCLCSPGSWATNYMLLADSGPVADTQDVHRTEEHHAHSGGELSQICVVMRLFELITHLLAEVHAPVAARAPTRSRQASLSGKDTISVLPEQIINSFTEHARSHRTKPYDAQSSMVLDFQGWAPGIDDNAARPDPWPRIAAVEPPETAPRHPGKSRLSLFSMTENDRPWAAQPNCFQPRLRRLPHATRRRR